MKKLLKAFVEEPGRTVRPEERVRRPPVPGDSLQLMTDVASAFLLWLSVFVLVDWITPVFSFVRSSWEMWLMTPDVALCFALLSAVLLYYNRHPYGRWGKATLLMAAAAVALWCAVDPAVVALKWLDGKFPSIFSRPFDFPEVQQEASPFTTLTLFLQSASLLFFPSLQRRHKRYGDWVGTLNLLIIIVNTLFMMNFLYGDPLTNRGSMATPGFAGVCSTSLLGVAMLGRLGFGYFPIRPFVGPSVDAVLLRKIMPVAMTAIVISSLLGNSLPTSLDRTLSSYLALLLSALIMIAVVLRASGVIGANLEEARKESERLYAGLVGSLEDLGVVLLNAQGRIILWNRGAERVTGYSASEVAGERVASLFPTDGIDIDKTLQDAVMLGAAQSQGWTERKGGTSFWVEALVTGIPGHDGVMVGYSLVIRDLTGKKRADDELQASLREKEVMLKEIHHRVKNNLQVISSLLRMQSEKAGDKAALELFVDSEQRVRAMAMVHEHLYQSHDLGRIDFPNYVGQLVQSLFRAYASSPSAQKPTVQVENMTMSLDTAVPCGLMLTELLSNALKYAYPKGVDGPIYVGFRLLPDGEHCELMVSDQGVGLPAEMDWKESEKTLGLRLVHLLARQLGGNVRLERGGGTKFIITF